MTNSIVIGDADDAHRQVYREDGGEQHEGKLSHELIAGAASFEGFKLYEDHQRKEGEFWISRAPRIAYRPLHGCIGKPVSHAFAKELLAGFVGGEVDKLAETKGTPSSPHCLMRGMS